MNKPYYKQIDIENEKKIRELLNALPLFCHTFFLGIESTTETRTRLAYAYDLKVFFNYLLENNPVFQKYPMHHIPIELMDQLKAQDIEEYISYLRVYEGENQKEHTNTELGIKRKLSALRSLYNYLYKKGMITANPASLVDTPKIHEKPIIHLDVDEIVKLLDEVESGDNLTAKQKTYHQKTKLRDLALITLLLGTGIRVSECVGLNLNDIDFENNGVLVHRKGGNEEIVYFGEEVKQVLLTYYEQREHLDTLDPDEEAFFLSLQKKRMSVRAVEKLVKKYAQIVTALKKITPHKLRSTYGTTLYQETGDIYLVADVLGHKDVNTTRKHYAQMSDQRRRSAANKVILREKK